MSKNHNNYEYRKATINHLAGTLPKPVAVVTLGVPKGRIKAAEDGSITQADFRASFSSIDMQRLHNHLGINQGGVLTEVWQPVQRPVGEPTLKGDEGTLFWVETLG